MLITRPNPSLRNYLSVNWQNPINWNHQLNKGLVSWWLTVPHWMGGTTFRDLCNKNHGTLTGMDPATDWITTDRPGGFGALDFDGSDDYVDTSTDEVSDIDVTLSFWFRTTYGSFHTAVSWGDGDGQSKINVGLHSNSQLWVSTKRVSAINTEYGLTNGLNDDEWHHAVVSLPDGENGSIYLDGKGDGDGTVLHQDAYQFDTFNLGCDYNGGSRRYYWNGQLDDLRIYNRALTPSEVRDLYHLSKQYQRGLLNRRTMIRSRSLDLKIILTLTGDTWVSDV